MTDALLTWACSYAFHSTVLIGGLWAVERAGGLARLTTGTQELLWRLALLGGLVSATLAAGLAPQVPSPAGASARAEMADVQPRAAVAAPPPRAPTAPGGAVTAPAAPATPATRVPQLGVSGWVAAVAPKAQDLAVAGVLVWLAGACVLLVGVALQWAWLVRGVRRLAPLHHARWQAWLAEQAAALGVAAPALRLARPGWASPLLAPGPVLCLPAWCLSLPDDEARAVLSHELAHLRRRDPAWRLLSAGVQALLWPQLLNRIALRRLDLLAELACDAAASTPAGQRLALAQSLLRCAEAMKTAGHRPGPALACGAVGGGSALVARVRQLLKPEGTPVPPERRALRWGGVAVMVAALLALPAVVVSHTQGRSLLERAGLDGVADALQLHELLTTGGHRRIYSRYPGGNFAVTVSGELSFNDAEDDVETLTGRIVVRERAEGLSREMTLVAEPGGGIQRSYRVGGEPAVLDDAGRRWWAQAVQRMAESLVAPEVRARKRFAQGGFEAVLADVERARDGHERGRRIRATLPLQQPLPAAVQDRLIAAAASIDSAFEKREALAAIARQPLAEAQQLAWLGAVAGIDSDFDRREALEAMTPQLLPQPAVLAAWGEVLARMGSDFEQRTAITAQVDAHPQPAVLAAALRAVTHLQGDFERREALGAVARQLQGDEAELVAAYAQAASGIAGGFERREALSQLLDRPRLTPAGLERVLASAEAMDGGFDRLQVLLRVAEKLTAASPVDAALVQRLRRAGRGLGDHERGQLENALDRLG
ncbi:M56 family metallopeptidase [Roseateles sp. BYS87W]|uniref:M56 family metallopeptidase n=1 Tax=Pelomonas baiyunensis TaxID=3299026 RepID=A0ABW7H4T8_9BURK